MNERHHRLYYWIQVCSAQLRRQANAELSQRAGLTATQLGALFFISQHEGCLLKELAAGLHIGGSAITTLVGRLERQELVTRGRSERDGRAYCLRLTPQGKAAIGRAVPRVAQLNDWIAKDFTDEELAVVTRFLQTTVERIQTLPTNPQEEES